MSSPIHAKQIISDGIHSAVSYTYPTSASLASSTGFDIYDSYKLALVTGDNSLWLLLNPLSVPPQWSPIPSGFLTGSISNVTGQGGTQVVVTAGVAAVSSSVPQVQRIVGQGNSNVTNAGTTWFVSSSGGGVGSIFVQGNGGSSVTGDGGFGNPFVVSSSIGADPSGSYALLRPDAGLPNASVLSSSTGVGLSGSTFTLAVVGLGGVSVSSGTHGEVIISGSVPTYSDIVGAGGTAVTVAGTIATVSSSAPSVEAIQGVGGIQVTNVGKTWLVSGALPPSGFFGQGGTAVTPSGNDYIFSSSVGADPNAPFAIVVANSSLPQARRLVAGTNVTFTDGGAGGTLTINATGGGGGGSSSAPFLTASYAGITGSGPVWKVANYTLTAQDDFVGVGTNVQNLTMSLPAASSVRGKIYYIADMYGSASVNPFQVKPAGSDTIDGTSGSYNSYANFGTYRLISLGDTWKSI